jgi:hypothetical protein
LPRRFTGVAVEEIFFSAIPKGDRETPQEKYVDTGNV